MRRVINFVLLVVLVGLAVGNFFVYKQLADSGQRLENFSFPRDTRLDKYTIENLRVRKYDSEIVFDEVVKSNDVYAVQKFHFLSDGKKVTGVANIPNSRMLSSERRSLENGPVIVMVRGYAEQKQFYSGFGTERVAGELAKAGYMTLAPDFLGYGGSDNPSVNPFEERFQTYTTLLNLLAGLQKSQNNYLKIAEPRIGIWAHSNGGQITLTTLAISEEKFPTVLWNPVSKPFPYGILFYTDDWDDSGRFLRSALSYFEKNYDTRKYSYTNYIDDIKAPILLQQGSADVQVPKAWSDELYQKLTEVRGSSTPSQPLRTSYLTYFADHNMLPSSWSQAVKDAVSWYHEELNRE